MRRYFGTASRSSADAHGRATAFIYGVAKKVLLPVFSTFMWQAALHPVSAADTPVTQLQYLQLVAQVTGESAQFATNAPANDYTKWAENKGMAPREGWNPGATLSRELMAETLAQLLNVTPQKGQDHATALRQQWSLNIPNTPTVSKADLTKTLNQQLAPSPQAVKAPPPPPPPGREAPPPRDKPEFRGHPNGNQENGQESDKKETICHKGHTITVSRNALKAHMAHGDTLGPCVVTETNNR